MFHAFARELVKIARQDLEEKLQAHFSAEKPDWKSFEKNLGSKQFRQAVVRAEQSDPKLKKYVKNYGGFVASKDVVGKVKGSSGKTYKLKKLAGGRIGCSCKDWQFIHSVQGGDCKHVKTFKAGKVKKASFTMGAVLADRTRRQYTRGKKSRATMLAARQQFGGKSPSMGIFPLIPD